MAFHTFRVPSNPCRVSSNPWAKNDAGGRAISRALAKGIFGAVFCAMISFAPNSDTANAAERASSRDTARFLAGLEVEETSPVRALTKSRIWKSHARSLDNGWRVLDRRQLSKIRLWSAENLKEPSKTLFYMFSGPDYLYANTLFPNASTYVFAGLEPVGKEPDLLNISSGSRSVGLSRLRGSMNSVLHLSFFITKKMKTNLRGAGFPGAIPILYVFLARADKEVVGLSHIKLNKDGSLVALSGKDIRKATGVKITFTDKAGGEPKTLYYFSTDISNGGLKRSGFLNFLGSLGTGDAFLKSASYLMHSGNFTSIRKFVLNNSVRIVQDDSGIPLRHFKKDGWKYRPFGKYLGPIKVFPGRYQNDMRRLFRAKNRQSIDFGIGYRWRKGASNLLVADKVTAPASAGDAAQDGAPAKKVLEPAQ